LIVVSLFDGHSCGRISLEQTGVHVEKYYTSEIDKYAMKVSDAIYPDNIKLGDITKWREWDIDWCSVDLLIGGSPCQGFSFAGKQLAFDDPRSALFFEYLNILNHIKKHNPQVKFMLENVRMKKEYLDAISSLLHVEPIQINSALVSAQNRVRYYWCNWDIKQPDDKGIFLKDIIEHGVVDRDKSFCIDANYWKGGNLKSYFEKHRRQLVFKGCECVGSITKKGYERDNRVYSESGKSPTILAHSGGNKEVKVFCAAMRGRYIVDGKRQDHKMKTAGLTTQRLEIRWDQKSNTLTTVQKDNYLVENFTIRKLTPRKCARLQTIPEHIIDIMLGCGASNSQIYKMLGNGFTINVIAHILKDIK
jgi:site-specific DNA-cytosine methylase